MLNPVLYSISMFDVVRMSATMQKVMRSLTYNIDQVVVTVFFMFLLLYVFAAWSFEFDYLYDFEGHSSCSEDYADGGCGGSFWDRFRLHMDYGVINPMVWGDTDGPVSSTPASSFSFLYYFLINLVITAIVSGIIIDTFAQMRSDRNEVRWSPRLRDD